MDERPFIVYSLPRSRTAWLSAYLSYGSWICTHEQAVTMRSWDDVKRFFSRERFGTVETGAAPGWRLVQAMRPDIKVVVIHRPVDEVLRSLRDIDVSSFARYDWDKAQRNFSYMARHLDKIAKQPGSLSIDFANLDTQETCERLFTHCLPFNFDFMWWDYLRRENIQIDVPAHLRYCLANRDKITAFKKECKSVLRSMLRAGTIKRREIAYG